MPTKVCTILASETGVCFHGGVYYAVGFPIEDTNLDRVIAAITRLYASYTRQSGSIGQADSASYYSE